jgi:hypothetical protein
MSADHLLDKTDIAKVLSSKGPVVKCVLLRAVPKDGKDSHPHVVCLDGKPRAVVEKVEQELGVIPQDNEKDDENGDSKPAPAPHHHHHRKVLDHLMEQLELDMTPSKSMVQETLGGPFTFLGQYEDEGIVVMIRKAHEDEEEYPNQEELEGLNVSELKLLLEDREIEPEGMLEKSDMVKALLKDFELPPVNPHQMQPPLHKKTVRGDILIVKVAETEEEMDQEDAEEKAIVMPTNDEFFLDYTMEQYIQFASRTDIEEHEIEEPEEGQGGDEDSDDEDSDEEEEGEGYALGDDDEDIAEEDKSAMFNLVMNEVLRQYREDNGRGPNTQELLELRSAIAKQLEVEVAEIDADGADWDKKAKETPSNKRKIAFSTDTKVKEFFPDPDEHDHHNAESDDEDYEEPPTKKLKSSGDDDDEDDDEEEEEEEDDDKEEEEDSKPAAIEKEPPISHEEKESKEPEKSDDNCIHKG